MDTGLGRGKLPFIRGSFTLEAMLSGRVVLTGATTPSRDGSRTDDVLLSWLGGPRTPPVLLASLMAPSGFFVVY